MPAKKKEIKKSLSKKTITREKTPNEPVTRKLEQKDRVLTAQGWKNKKRKEQSK